MTAHDNLPASLRARLRGYLSTFEVGADDISTVEEAFDAFTDTHPHPKSWNGEDFVTFLEDWAPELAKNALLRAAVNQFLETAPVGQAEEDIKRFELALKEDDCSSSTIRNYRSDIGQFVEFCETEKTTEIIEKPKLVAFSRYQRAKGLKDSSIARKLSSITRFGSWLVEHDAMPPQPWLDSLDLDVVFPEDNEAVAVPSATAKNSRSQEKMAIAEETSDTDSDTPRWKQYLPDFLSKRASLPDDRNAISELGRNYILPYLNLAMIVLFLIGFGVFGYQQFFVEAPQQLAYPSSPTRATRTLSFQGRLTNTAQSPITSSTTMQFRLYDADSGGTQLWSSGSCSVDPDQDGIFSVGLGSDCGSEIGENVFTENSNVWLEAEVASETLTPRQPIRTVAYAVNSETVQGFPISATESATANTILVMDEAGQVRLGEVSPSLISNSGTFTIEGEALTLQTQTGSNGDITLAPDGTGGTNILSDLDLDGYLQAPGATLSANYAGATPLSIEAAASQTGDLLAVTSDGGTAGDLFMVDGSGNVGVGTTSPNSLMHIESSTLTNGNLFTIKNTGTGDADASFVLDSGDTGESVVRLANQGTEEFQFGITGNLNGFTIFDSQESEHRLFLESPSGNVGIGTTSPGYRLDVNGTLRASSTVNFSGLATGTDNSVLILNGSNDVVTDEIDSRVWDSNLVDGSSNSVNYIPVWDDSNTLTNSVMYEDNSGEIGIGTITPSTRLDVNGDGIFGGSGRVQLGDVTSGSNSFAGIWIGDPNSSISSPSISNYAFLKGNGNTIFNTPSGENINFRVGNSTKLTLWDSGGLSLGANYADHNVSSNDPGADNFIIEGDVGIGTTSPGELLDVAGNATVDQLNINNAFTFPTADGTSNQALTTDGSGTVTWSDVLTSASQLWTASNGAIYPKNNTQDLLLGSTATSSARAAFLNIDSGTPTASVSAGASGGAYLAADGTLQTTANQNLTIGGDTTGNITLSPLNGSGSVNITSLGSGVVKASSGELSVGNVDLTSEVTGILPTANGGTGLDGSSATDGQLLIGNGSGYSLSTLTEGEGIDITNSSGSITLAGEDASTTNKGIASFDSSFFTASSGNISVGADVFDFTELADSLSLDSATTISNGLTGDLTIDLTSTGDFTIADNGITFATFTDSGNFTITGSVDSDTGFLTNGTTRIDSSGNLQNIGTTDLNGVTYTWPGADGTTGQALTTNGSGSLSWDDVLTSASQLWTASNGAIYPKNSTQDLLLGGTSTSSARAAFLNIDSGTPTASVSAGTSGGAYLAADGTLQTTANQQLSLGGNTTGDIILNGDGNGSVGIGTTSPVAKIHVVGNTNQVQQIVQANSTQTANIAEWRNNSGTNLVSIGSSPEVSMRTIDTFTSFSSGTNNYVSLKSGAFFGNSAETLDIVLGDTNKGLRQTVADIFGTNDIFFQQIARSDDTNAWGVFETWNLKGMMLGTGQARPLAFATNRTERMRLDGSGNLGIGTTSPSSLLDVAGLITGQNLTLTSLSAGTDDTVLTLNGSNAVETREIDSRVWGSSLTDGSGTANYIPRWSDSDTLTDSILYDDGTNIGIGTASPGFKLDVDGSANLSTGNTFKINGTDVLSSTTLGSGVINSSLTSVGALDSGSITSNFGNINIGTSTLDAGTTNLSQLTINSAFTFPTSDGATGQTLTTDGSGTVSWSDAANINDVLWTSANGAIYPKNTTQDLLLGGTATSSARAAFLNIDSGTPTASVSAGTNGATFITADGTISTTNSQDIRIGAGTTTLARPGDIHLNNDVTGFEDIFIKQGVAGKIFFGDRLTEYTVITGFGSVGIKNENPAYSLDVTGNTNLSSSYSYKINGTDVLSSTTLGSGVVNSSLTSTGALDSGSITSNFGNIDIGTSTIDAGAITGTTLDLTSLSSGTDDTVLTLNGSFQVEVREIDSRAWGSSLVDGSGTANYVPRWSDSDTLADSAIYDDGSGNIGIGTTDPDHALTTSVAADTLGSVISSTINIGEYIGIGFRGYEDDPVSNPVKSAVTHIRTGGWGTGDIAFLVNSAASNTDVTLSDERMRITTGGDVGIGTTSPNYKLDVDGSTNLSTGNTFKINGTDVLSATTLGSGVVNSSLTSVGALDSGSITSNFGNINIGTSTIDAGAITGTTITGTTLTDGTLSISSGSITGGVNGTFSGDLSSATLDLTGLSTGTDDTVLTLNGTTDAVESREIDSRAFGSSLVDGSGTANYIPRWSDSDTLTDSILYDDGTNVGIGTTTLTETLTVAGNSSFTAQSASDVGLRIQGAASQTGDLTLWENNSGTDLASIDSNGNMSAGRFSDQANSSFFLDPAATDVSLTTAGKASFGSSTAEFPLFATTGNVTGKALFALNETGNQNIITASASGTEQMRLTNSGRLYARSFYDLDGFSANYLDPSNTGTSLDIAGDIQLAKAKSIKWTNDTNIIESAAGLEFDSAEGFTFDLDSDNNGGTNEFTITDNGSTRFKISENQLSIGTSTMSNTLRVEGTSRLNGTVFVGKQNSSGEGGEIVFEGSDTYEDLRFDVINGDARFYETNTSDRQIYMRNFGSGQTRFEVEAGINPGEHTSDPYTCSSTYRGYMYYNTNDAGYRFCDGSNWVSLAKESDGVGFEARLSGSNIGVGTSSEKLITYDLESFDSGNDYDNSTTYEFTVPESGKYLINAQVAVSGTDPTYRIEIHRNNGVWRQGFTEQQNYAQISALTEDTSGNTYEIVVENVGSNFLTVQNYAQISFWSMVKLPDISTGADLAEYYITRDMQTSAGEIVSISNQDDIAVSRTNPATAQDAVGIVSTVPGMTLGSSTASSGETLTPASAEELERNGYLMENGQAKPVPVALSGRVPLKVTTENGVIERGDYVTISQTKDGYGAKATQPGMTVGRAMETHRVGQSDYITVFVDTDYVTSEQLHHRQQLEGELAELSRPGAGTSLTRLETMQLDLSQTPSIESIAMNLEDVQTAFNHTIKTLRNLSRLDLEFLRSDRVETARLDTDLISPTADGNGDIEVRLGDTTDSTDAADTPARLEITDRSGSVAASIDETGQIEARSLLAQEIEAGTASFSGNISAATISAETVETKSLRLQQLEGRVAQLETVKAEAASFTTATVSGTLFAGNIDQFEDRVAAALEEPSLLEKLLGKDTATTSAETPSYPAYDTTISTIATDSAAAELALSPDELDLSASDITLSATAGFFEQHLQVAGNAYVGDSLGVENRLVVGDGLTIGSGSINYAGRSDNTLRLQPDGGSLEILAGIMTLNEDGQVRIDGDLSVTGQVAAASISTETIETDENITFTGPAADLDSTSNATEAARTPVATISAQGRASFADLIEADSLSVSSEDSTEAELNDAGAIPTTATSGRARLRTGETQLTIENERITEDSLIYITPSGSTGNQVLYVAEQISAAAEDVAETTDTVASFTVAIDEAIDSDIDFNWWIVN